MNNTQFKIEQKLNESATTVVYRAFDEVLHRTVLLKVLHKHLTNDTDLKQRFIREARACAALRSEHIVQIYDLTEIDGAPAIVMEFVEGKSLKEAIASGVGGTLEFAATVGIHVLRALTVAHERGIIHRDIKPGNILVSDKGTIKVTDFGLAYVALSPTVTMEGMVLGTPAYMAPEQVRGDDIDERTDLFALGVTLVESLTGERIFEGSTYSECMKKVLSFSVKELDRFDERSSPEFSAFLRKLLHPVKSDRFESSREALAAIDTASPTAVLKSEVSPKRGIVPYGIAAIIIVAIFVFVWMQMTSSEQPKLSDEQFQPVDTSNTLHGAVKEEEIAVPSESSPTPISTPVTTLVPEKTNRHSSIDSGKIALTSTPWAKVYIDNQLIGETPIAKPIAIASGNHTVMFAHPSFDPIVKTILVESGKELSVFGNFMDNAGYLMCVVIPWAEVFVDEQYKDTTPLTKPLMLSSGKHTIRFKNASFSDIIREVAITPKDTTTVTIKFQ